MNSILSKWFLDVKLDSQYPPQTRYPGSSVKRFTEGNKLVAFRDAASMMAEFHRQMSMLLNSNHTEDYLVGVAGMGIQDVKLLGENGDGETAITLLNKAAKGGAGVYLLASGQVGLGRESAKICKELNRNGGHGATDKRSQFLLGGHHQKFWFIVKPDGRIVGSMNSGDFFHARWDTYEHIDDNPDRSPKGEQTHDCYVRIEGPGALDLVNVFADKWNDKSSAENTHPKIDCRFPIESIPEQGELGTQKMQILLTYPQQLSGKKFTWSGSGEFTIWAAYLQNIKQAKKYIYIEDQYMYTFRDPALVDSNNPEKENDIVYQLGEAIKRGVDVVALVPSRNGSMAKHYELQQRRRAASYLKEISKESEGSGRFVMSFMRVGKSDPTIHSKLILIDDEYAIVGSANICQRSMNYNPEIMIGIVDDESEWVKEYRKMLWMDHFGFKNSDSLDDYKESISIWIDESKKGKGRLREFPSERFRREMPYGFLLNRIIDPCEGPVDQSSL